MKDWACIVKTLPFEREQKAAQLAYAMNLTDAAPELREVEIGAERLVALQSKYWRSDGVILSVGFLDGPEAALRQRILGHMNAWGRTANVRFIETSGDALVRIARTPDKGYWSYVGTDILDIAKDQPTMNLAAFTTNTPDSEFYRVVRHEAGHTLGFPHEHLRREIVDRIDREKAIAYFMTTQGWDLQTVIAAVLTPLDYSALLASASPDPASIMCYSLPASIMRDGVAVVGGVDIDGQDAQFAAQLYPTWRSLLLNYLGPQAQVQYREASGSSAQLNGWTDVDDLQLVGDFKGLGYDQVLFINRSGSDGRVMILDYQGAAPQVRYAEAWGQSAQLNGWIDSDDIQLVGDFKGLGYDQVLFINRGGSGGRVMILDFKGAAPQVRYSEEWGQSAQLNGWTDIDDIQRVGDFKGLGYDQLLFINRGGSGGRVMILDFKGAAPQVRYSEEWGQSAQLNGWTDIDDIQQVGDFKGLGYDQVLFINRGGSGGRVMILDFKGAAPQVRYSEEWGQSAQLNGWTDIDDIQRVGDFKGLGYDQLLFINRGGSGGRVMIVDYKSAAARVLSWEDWYSNPPRDALHGPADLQLSGAFKGARLGHVLLIRRAP